MQQISSFRQSVQPSCYTPKDPADIAVMKLCPECRRNYYDESLLYCLDDGRALLDGPADIQSAAAAYAGEPATVIVHGTAAPPEPQTKGLAAQAPVSDSLNPIA